MKVRLTKIASTHNNVRTDTMDGEAYNWPPKKGEDFVLIGKGLTNPNLDRVLRTTPIQEVEFLGGPTQAHQVKTLNSTYRLEVLDPGCESCGAPAKVHKGEDCK